MPWVTHMSKFMYPSKSYHYANRHFSKFLDITPYVEWMEGKGGRSYKGITEMRWIDLCHRIDSMEDSLRIFIRRHNRLPRYTNASEYERKKFVFMVERYPNLTMRELAIKFKVA